MLFTIQMVQKFRRIYFLAKKPRCIFYYFLNIQVKRDLPCVKTLIPFFLIEFVLSRLKIMIFDKVYYFHLI